MDNLTTGDIHQYILNEGVDDIFSKLKSFEGIMSVLPNGSELRDSFSSIIKGILIPGKLNKQRASQFVLKLSNSTSQYLKSIGINGGAAVVNPKMLTRVGVIGIASLIIKLMDIIRKVVLFTKNKTMSSKEFQKQINLEIKNLNQGVI